MMKPCDWLTACCTSSRVATSRLRVFTPTPPLVMPRLMACASAQGQEGVRQEQQRVIKGAPVVGREV